MSKFARPVKLEVTFKRTVNAEVVSYLQGVERVRGNAILFTASDMLQASPVLQCHYGDQC